MSPLERLARAKLQVLTKQKKQSLLQDFATQQAVKNLRRQGQDFKQQVQPEYAQVSFKKGQILNRKEGGGAWRGPAVGLGRGHQVRGSMLPRRIEDIRKKRKEKLQRERFGHTVKGTGGSKIEASPFMKWTTEGYRDVPGVETGQHMFGIVGQQAKKKKLKNKVLVGFGLEPTRPMSFTS